MAYLSKELLQVYIEKVVNTRQAFSNPDVPLSGLRPFAKEVGINEEEWIAVIEAFHDYLDKGKNFLKNRNWQDGIEELEQAVKIEPLHEDVLQNLAQAYAERWWEHRRTGDKKKGVFYGERCLEANPQNNRAAKIVTELKQAPFKPWISYQTQWKLLRYAIWLTLLGGGGWYVYQHRESLLKEAQTYLKKPEKAENKKENVVLENVLFDAGSTVLNIQSKIALDKFIKYLQDNPKIEGKIVGFTDNSGYPAQNLQISEMRAKAVYQYLIDKGIAVSRLTYAGLGDAYPLHPNTNEENRAKNRRIEFRSK